MTHDEEQILKHLSNRWWRLNNLYWIMDEQGNKIRFRINTIQKILYFAMWWLNLILKSRQHGITTFIAIFFLDACLFNTNIRAGVIAHKLTAAQKIFRDKILFAYDNLPVAIKQARPALKRDGGELLLSNNSSVYVDTSMRSGTLQYLHISEYGYVCAHAAGRAREIKSGALETIHEGGYVFIESTSEGMGNDFHFLCESAQKKQQENTELTRLDYKFHFFPWYKKPDNILTDNVYISEKDKEYFDKIEKVKNELIDEQHRKWYVKKKATLKDLIYSQHPSTPEEAFMASLEGAYYGHEMIKVKEDGRIGHYPWEKGAKVFTFWDIGSIHTAIWFWQFVRETIRVIDFHYDNTGQGLTEHIKLLQNKPYVYGEHWCGWDIDPEYGSNRKNTTTGKFIKDEAENLGIIFNILEKLAFKDRIQAVKMVLDKCYFHKETTEFGVRGLFSYRQSINTAMSTDDKTVYNKNPEPGPECHICDAFGHGAMAYIYNIYIDGTRIGATKQNLPSPSKHKYYNDNVLTRGLNIKV